MQLWSLWSYTLSWAAWDNGWSLRARLQRLSQLPPAIALPAPQCLGGGHMGMASARAVTRSWWWQRCLPVFFTLSMLRSSTCPSLLLCHTTAPGGMAHPDQLTRHWRELLQAQILPLGSLYSSRGVRIHIWTCRKNTCKAPYRQVQINVVWTSRWLQPTRENLVPRVRCNKASLSMPSSVVQHT